MKIKRDFLKEIIDNKATLLFREVISDSYFNPDNIIGLIQNEIKDNKILNNYNQEIKYDSNYIKTNLEKNQFYIFKEQLNKNIYDFEAVAIIFENYNDGNHKVDIILINYTSVHHEKSKDYNVFGYKFLDINTRGVLFLDFYRSFMAYCYAYMSDNMYIDDKVGFFYENIVNKLLKIKNINELSNLDDEYKILYFNRDVKYGYFYTYYYTVVYLLSDRSLNDMFIIDMNLQLDLIEKLIDILINCLKYKNKDDLSKIYDKYYDNSNKKNELIDDILNNKNTYIKLSIIYENLLKNKLNYIKSICDSINLNISDDIKNKIRNNIDYLNILNSIIYETNIVDIEIIYNLNDATKLIVKQPNNIQEKLDNIIDLKQIEDKKYENMLYIDLFIENVLNKYINPKEKEKEGGINILNELTDIYINLQKMIKLKQLITNDISYYLSDTFYEKTKHILIYTSNLFKQYGHFDKYKYGIQLDKLVDMLYITEIRVEKQLRHNKPIKLTVEQQKKQEEDINLEKQLIVNMPQLIKNMLGTKEELYDKIYLLNKSYPSVYKYDFSKNIDDILYYKYGDNSEFSDLFEFENDENSKNNKNIINDLKNYVYNNHLFLVLYYDINIKNIKNIKKKEDGWENKCDKIFNYILYDYTNIKKKFKNFDYNLNDLYKEGVNKEEIINKYIELVLNDIFNSYIYNKSVDKQKTDKDIFDSFSTVEGQLDKLIKDNKVNSAIKELTDYEYNGDISNIVFYINKIKNTEYKFLFNDILMEISDSKNEIDMDKINKIDIDQLVENIKNKIYNFITDQFIQSYNDTLEKYKNKDLYNIYKDFFFNYKPDEQIDISNIDKNIIILNFIKAYNITINNELFLLLFNICCFTKNYNKYIATFDMNNKKVAEIYEEMKKINVKTTNNMAFKNIDSTIEKEKDVLYVEKMNAIKKIKNDVKLFIDFFNKNINNTENMFNILMCKPKFKYNQIMVNNLIDLIRDKKNNTFIHNNMLSIIELAKKSILIKYHKIPEDLHKYTSIYTLINKFNYNELKVNIYNDGYYKYGKLDITNQKYKYYSDDKKIEILYLAISSIILNIKHKLKYDNNKRIKLKYPYNDEKILYAYDNIYKNIDKNLRLNLFEDNQLNQNDKIEIFNKLMDITFGKIFVYPNLDYNISFNNKYLIIYDILKTTNITEQCKKINKNKNLIYLLGDIYSNSNILDENGQIITSDDLNIRTYGLKSEKDVNIIDYRSQLVKLDLFKLFKIEESIIEQIKKFNKDSDYINYYMLLCYLLWSIGWITNFNLNNFKQILLEIYTPYSIVLYSCINNNINKEHEIYFNYFLSNINNKIFNLSYKDTKILECDNFFDYNQILYSLVKNYIQTEQLLDISTKIDITYRYKNKEYILGGNNYINFRDPVKIYFGDNNQYVFSDLTFTNWTLHNKLVTVNSNNDNTYNINNFKFLKNINFNKNNDVLLFDTIKPYLSILFYYDDKYYITDYSYIQGSTLYYENSGYKITHIFGSPLDPNENYTNILDIIKISKCLEHSIIAIKDDIYYLFVLIGKYINYDNSKLKTNIMKTDEDILSDLNYNRKNIIIEINEDFKFTYKSTSDRNLFLKLCKALNIYSTLDKDLNQIDIFGKLYYNHKTVILTNTFIEKYIFPVNIDTVYLGDIEYNYNMPLDPTKKYASIFNELISKSNIFLDKKSTFLTTSLYLIIKDIKYKKDDKLQTLYTPEKTDEITDYDEIDQINLNNKEVKPELYLIKNESIINIHDYLKSKYEYLENRLKIFTNISCTDKYENPIKIIKEKCSKLGGIYAHAADRLESFSYKNINICNITTNKDHQRLEVSNTISKNIESIYRKDIINFLVFNNRYTCNFSSDANYLSIYNLLKQEYNKLIRDYKNIYINHPYLDLKLLLQDKLLILDEQLQQILDFIVYNSLIKKTRKLYNIISSNEDINIKLNIESDNYPNYLIYNYDKINQNDFLPYVLIYETEFGSYLRCPQLKLINDFIKIIFDNNQDIPKIQQLLMGSGKTTVIAPLITLISNKKYPKVINCMPNHLIQDSYELVFKYIYNYIDHIYKDDPSVTKNIIESHIQYGIYISPISYIKINIKNTDYYKYDDNTIIIFDEIHDLCDNLKSELIKTDLVKNIDNPMYHIVIIDHIYNNRNDNIDEISNKIKSMLFVDNIDTKFVKELYQEYIKLHDTIIESRKLNLNFGPIENEIIAVPYVAANKPTYKNNKFKDYKLTLFYTYIMYKSIHVSLYAMYVMTIDIFRQTVKIDNIQILEHIKKIITNKNINYIEQGDYDYVFNLLYKLIEKYHEENEDGELLKKYNIELDHDNNLKNSNEYNSIDYSIYFLIFVYENMPLEYRKIENEIKNTMVVRLDLDEKYTFIDDDLLYFIYYICSKENSPINIPVISHVVSTTDVLSHIYTKNKIAFSGTPDIHLLDNQCFNYCDVNINWVNNKYITNDEKEYTENFKQTVQELYKLDELKFDKIGFQDGANGEIIFTLSNGSIINKENKKLVSSDIYDILIENNCNTLIDCGALCLDKTQKEFIEEFLQKDGVNYTYGIYIDNNDKKWIFNKEKHELYNGKQYYQFMLQDQIFTYFDHAHTLGVDIELNINSKAIVTLNHDSTYDKISQGVYRLRKINKNQSFSYLYDMRFDNTLLTIDKLIDKLFKNTSQKQKDNYLLFIRQLTMTKINTNDVLLNDRDMRFTQQIIENYHNIDVSNHDAQIEVNITQEITRQMEQQIDHNYEFDRIALHSINFKTMDDILTNIQRNFFHFLDRHSMAISSTGMNTYLKINDTIYKSKLGISTVYVEDAKLFGFIISDKKIYVIQMFELIDCILNLQILKADNNYIKANKKEETIGKYFNIDKKIAVIMSTGDVFFNNMTDTADLVDEFNILYLYGMVYLDKPYLVKEIYINYIIDNIDKLKNKIKQLIVKHINKVSNNFEKFSYKYPASFILEYIYSTNENEITKENLIDELKKNNLYHPKHQILSLNAGFKHIKKKKFYLCK